MILHFGASFQFQLFMLCAFLNNALAIFHQLNGTIKTQQSETKWENTQILNFINLYHCYMALKHTAVEINFKLRV